MSIINTGGLLTGTMLLRAAPGPVLPLPDSPPGWAVILVSVVGIIAAAVVVRYLRRKRRRE